MVYGWIKKINKTDNVKVIMGQAQMRSQTAKLYLFVFENDEVSGFHKQRETWYATKRYNKQGKETTQPAK